MAKQKHDYLLKITDPEYKPKHAKPLWEGTTEELYEHLQRVIESFGGIINARDLEISQLKRQLLDTTTELRAARKAKREPINDALIHEVEDLKRTIKHIQADVEGWFG